jgi:hypothetical protein
MENKENNSINEMLDYLFNLIMISEYSVEGQNAKKKIEEILNNNYILLSQEKQDLIAKKQRELLPKISNITGKTIINFCDRLLREENIKILWEAYMTNIKPRLNEFVEKEYNKELKIALLSSIEKQEILKMMDLEMLSLYDSIMVDNINLSEDDYIEILGKNPKFISQIDEPSEKLQLLALSSWPGYPMEALRFIENPCDQIYAIILTKYYCDNPNFKGKFDNNVPENIIENVLKITPNMAFWDTCKNHLKRECNISEKVKAITINPEMLNNLDKKHITPEFVVELIKELPISIQTIGGKFGIYTTTLTTYARGFLDKYKGDERKKVEQAINSYQAVIDERIESQRKLDETFNVLIKK